MSRIQQLERWDRTSFFHPSTHLAEFSRGEAPNRILARGDGVFIQDVRGNRLLDAFAGLYCVNVGYGCREVIDAIKSQAEQLAYYHAYAGNGTEPAIELAKMIVDRAPSSMSRVYFGLSGSDANETNIKLVWYYNNILERPQRKKIISRWRGYHGSGLMTGSLTGLDLFHKKFDLPFPQVIHTEAPYYFRREQDEMDEGEFSAWCAGRLERLILKEGAETVAAFIGEPALGTGGLVPPPDGYWEKIHAVLKKYEILLIMDEVITGFGRLGSMFGSDRYGISPDIITVAKGLTSAYAPLSGSVVSDGVWRVLEQGTDEFGLFGHGWTYSAHPVCAAAAAANLKMIDKLGLVGNAAEMGSYLKGQLQDALEAHPHVGDVRGEGLLIAVEFVEDKRSRRLYEPQGRVGAEVADALLGHGVIGRAMPQGDILGIAPPLCITRGEADIIVEAVRKSVEDVLGA